MAESSFDELIHATLRLTICSLLASVDSMAFAVVRDNLGITDAHLSKQVKILADAGHVAATKQGVTKPHRCPQDDMALPHPDGT